MWILCSIWEGNVNHTNSVTKVCRARTDFSPEREKKTRRCPSKDYREDESRELWLSFDKSYWADGSSEAEHSKKLEQREVVGMQGEGRATLNDEKILILLHF